jgi:hypothetical protein
MMRLNEGVSMISKLSEMSKLSEILLTFSVDTMSLSTLPSVIA